jgi:hypothetical protein
MFFGICSAEAVQFTATVAVDNYCAIYSGNPQNLTLVGRGGNDFNLCNPSIFTFNVNPGDYIYVAAWNSVDTNMGQGPKAWLGQFVSDGQTILSNTTDWQVYLTYNLAAVAGNAAPSIDAVKIDLAKASWIPINYSVNHGSGIWGSLCNGYIAGIDPNAKWIWGSSMSQYDNYGDYQIFRTQVMENPETIPVAKAGADQTVNAWIDGFASVSLDASGSYDENNQALTYRWHWTIAGNTNQAEGEYPNIQLPAGEHAIQLIVNNGYQDSEPSLVHVTVIPPMQQKLTIYPSTLKRVDWFVINTMATMTLPSGVAKTDIRNQQFLLYPAGSTQSVKGSLYYFQKNAYARILFKRLDLMKIIPNNGKVTVYVVGQLNSGQYFFGSDTITIYP